MSFWKKLFSCSDIVKNEENVEHLKHENKYKSYEDIINNIINNNVILYKDENGKIIVISNSKSFGDYCSHKYEKDLYQTYVTFHSYNVNNKSFVKECNYRIEYTYSNKNKLKHFTYVELLVGSCNMSKLLHMQTTNKDELKNIYKSFSESEKHKLVKDSEYYETFFVFHNIFCEGLNSIYTKINMFDYVRINELLIKRTCNRTCNDIYNYSVIDTNNELYYTDSSKLNEILFENFMYDKISDDSVEVINQSDYEKYSYIIEKDNYKKLDEINKIIDGYIDNVFVNYELINEKMRLYNYRELLEIETVDDYKNFIKIAYKYGAYNLENFSNDLKLDDDNPLYIERLKYKLKQRTEMKDERV